MVKHKCRQSQLLVAKLLHDYKILSDQLKHFGGNVIGINV